MASRSLLRRFSQVTRRLCVRPVAVSRSLITLSQATQEHAICASPLSYCQIRGLCSKGEGMVINIQDEADFQERVINSNKPVVVDFHASWCGPCKLLGPRLESLVGSKEGKVVLAKLDIDELAEVAMDYDIRSVPTVIAFKDKKVFAQFVGLQEDDRIDTFLDKLIG